MASHFFGPLGAMERLTVSAGVSTETARAYSEFVSSGGVRHVQRGRAAPRTWTVGRLYQGPDWARILSMAAHGLLPQCWLYDVAAARENMVPAQLAAGSGAPVLVGGLPLGGLPVGHVVSVPVLAGHTYSVSAWCAVDAEMLAYVSGGGPSIPVESLGGSGSASFTALEDEILTVTVTRAGVSGLRINDGPFDGRFYAGHGTPCKVAVQDPQRTLQLVTERVRSDYQVTLLEVGKPGLI